ncbi:hypothetical protein HMPREF0682_1192 [Propionibacterium acidifaciens F0233]|uniref:Uncharacterized protein n=1 Tax=Propionibacterium acidifaciens F0233 TaxID=553198 RepID=U2SCE1_9ACTN|nr:hypothetical protein HMPREF0682_1192 [Propionibacterium acidifaciens F0233]
MTRRGLSQSILSIVQSFRQLLVAALTWHSGGRHAVSTLRRPPPRGRYAPPSHVRVRPCHAAHDCRHGRVRPLSCGRRSGRRPGRCRACRCGLRVHRPRRPHRGNRSGLLLGDQAARP